MEKYSLNYFKKYLDYLREHDLYPKIREVQGPSTSPIVRINNKEYLTFCSNNYLGLAEHPEVKKKTSEAIGIYGTGSGSTRLLSGSLDIQSEFEAILAKHFGYDSSITFSSGYLANAGAIRMLVDPFPYFRLPSLKSLFAEGSGLIISDELNHASIIDGVRLAKADRTVFKHNDMKDLEKILSSNTHKRKLVITDGVFSMDGDIADLCEITKLTKMYDALLFVDDSHAVGVLGPKGEGVAKYLGVEQDVDVLMGSFTKAFGSIGGFIATNKTISDYMRITARSYIFSDPIPPAIVYGLITTLRVIAEGDILRKKVMDNADRLRNGLKKAGFIVLGDKTPIVPLFIGNEKKAIEFADYLYEAGILAPCVRRPAVLEGKERIRFSVMASHSFEQIDKLLNVCSDIKSKIHLLI